MKTSKEVINEKLKETGIEIGIWSHSILGYSCYVDTTKHDEEVIRKFAEWCHTNGISFCFMGNSDEEIISNIIKRYKRSRKE